MFYILFMNKNDATLIHDKILAVLLEEQEKRGISNYKIAQITGISQSFLSYLKHSSAKPTLLILIMIADAIGVKLSDVIRRVEESANSAE